MVAERATFSRATTAKWNLAFNYFAVAYAIVSGIVLVPLYLEFIPLHVYGAWLAVGNIVAWIAVIDPGLSPILMQRVSAAYAREDGASLSGLLTNGLLLSALIALVVGAIGVAVAPFVVGFLKLPDVASHELLTTAFLFAVAGTSLMIFSYGITAFNQGLQSSLGIGVIFMATSIASLVLTVALLFGGYGILSLPLALLFRGVCMTAGNSAYLAWRIRAEQIRLSPSFAQLKDLATLMSYTFLGRSVSTIAHNIDAVIVTRYLNVELAPVLALTRKAPDLSRMVLERPAVAFMPSVANLYATGNLERSREVLLRLLRFVLWIAVMAALGFALLNEAFVRLWVGQTLFAGHAVNAVIAAELLVVALTSTLANSCYALGNIKGNSVAMLAQGVISVPLMILGALYLGILGVALAPLVAVLCTSVWYYPRVFARLLEIPRSSRDSLTREAWSALGAAVGSFATLFWVQASTWWSFFAAVALVSATYLLFLAALSTAFRQEVGIALRRMTP